MHKLGSSSSSSSFIPLTRHSVRYVSTRPNKPEVKQTSRLGRKGWLYGVDHEQQDITPEETVRITKRRIQKAERDERIDITAALTPVKTYMSGFTRPRDLRSSNWWPGGPYRARNKVYEKPVTSAYEPYTVFVLESRYPIVHGIGRVDAHEHLVGVCREADLPGILELYNSGPKGPGNERDFMDKARWPWTRQKAVRATKWWGQGEDPIEIRQAVLEDINAPPGEKQFLYFGGDGEIQAGRKVEHRETLDEAPHIGVKPKKEVEAERWGTLIDGVKEEEGFEQRLSAREMQRREKVAEAKSKMFGSSMGDNVAAPTTTSESLDDSTTFTAPSATVPLSATKATESTHEPNEAMLASSTASSAPTTEALSSLTMEGSTPAHAVLLSSPTEMSAPMDEAPASEPDRDKDHEPSRTILDETSQAKADTAAQHREHILQLRSEYTPTLADTPFWRPLITATFSTRPLAMSVARLSKGLSRGLPYHATMTSHDRKARISYSGRIRGMRLLRLTDLVVDAAQLLDGWRGGFIGMRYSPDDVGRGTDGEHLAKGVPFAKRLIKIGVGEWYPLAQETLNIFQDAAARPPHTLTRGPAGESALDLFKLDERGYRIDAHGQRVPYPQQPRAPEDAEMEGLLDAWLGEALDEEVDEALEVAPERNFNLDKTEMKWRVRQRVLDQRRQELSRGDPDKVALALAERGPNGFVQLPRKAKWKQLLDGPPMDLPSSSQEAWV